jgi:hypothetical protein
LFPGLDAPSLKPQVPPSFAKTYEEARTLFLECLSNLSAAKAFFKLDGYVTDHVTIIQVGTSVFGDRKKTIVLLIILSEGLKLRL